MCGFQDTYDVCLSSSNALHTENNQCGHEIRIKLRDHFLTLLNEVLAEITGQPENIFNPKAILVDEHGVSFWDIREVFDQDFVMWRVVSYQMHYKSDVNKPLAKVGGVLKVKLKKISSKMCIGVTIAEYNRKDGLFGWIQWSTTFFLHFTDLAILISPIAENGNSLLKSGVQLWLLEATWDDITTNGDTGGWNESIPWSGWSVWWCGTKCNMMLYSRQKNTDLYSQNIYCWILWCKY